MELLTSPRPFDDQLLDLVKGVVVEPQRFGRVYGEDLLHMYTVMIEACRKMCLEGNPLIKELSNFLRDQAVEKRDVRIFCHKNAKDYFSSLVGEVSVNLASDTPFLHTLKQYTQAGIFDDLIKVGPLRSRGWGAIPDAVLTARHYRRLVQFVWSGCLDEEDFGFDPVYEFKTMQLSVGEHGRDNNGLLHRWKTSSIKKQYAQKFSGELIEEIDDIKDLPARSRGDEAQPAVLIEFGGQGVFIVGTLR